MVFFFFFFHFLSKITMKLKENKTTIGEGGGPQQISQYSHNSARNKQEIDPE